MTSKSANRKSAEPVQLAPAQLISKQQQVLTIDVRGWPEYIMGHIPGAQCLSRDRILQDIARDRAIVFTCLSGQRSLAAAQWAIAQGYRQVYNLQGGLMAWHSAGYTVQRGTQP